MAQSKECLLHKYEDLSLILSTHIKSQVLWPMLMIQALEVRDWKIPRAYWVATVDESTSPTFIGSACFKI